MEPNVCPTNSRFVGNRNAFDKRVKGVVPHNPGSQIERQFVCAVKSPAKELSFFRGVKSDSVLTFSPSILSVCEGAGGD